MKIAKIVGIIVAVYVGIVVLFESGIGYLQPQGDDTLVLIMTDAEGNSSNRVLSRIEIDGQLYVAVNHWPRAWYWKVLEKPAVRVTFNGETADYTAVNVETGDEAEMVNAARPRGAVFLFLTGFPPRRFVRLDSPA